MWKKRDSFWVWGFGDFSVFLSKKYVFLSKNMSFCQKNMAFCQNPAAVFINTTAVAVIIEAVFANAKNVCDREKICFCRK